MAILMLTGHCILEQLIDEQQSLSVITARLACHMLANDCNSNKGTWQIEQVALESCATNGKCTAETCNCALNAHEAQRLASSRIGVLLFI